MQYRESPSAIVDCGGSKIILMRLPPHLRNEFLGKDDSLLVIIASDLNVHQLGGLVKVLKRFKRAIVWTIYDIF